MAQAAQNSKSELLDSAKWIKFAENGISKVIKCHLGIAKIEVMNLILQVLVT